MSFRFAHSNSRPSYVDYYVGIDLHKTEAQVTVLDDEGQMTKMYLSPTLTSIRLNNNIGNEAVIETGNNYFTIVDTLNEYPDVMLANSVQANWLDSQTQKNDR